MGQLGAAGALGLSNQLSQYEYAIDGHIKASNNNTANSHSGASQSQINASTNKSSNGNSHLLAKSKVNPMSGGIPISTILPQRTNNSELTSY